jgi:hypothetical protein
MRLLKDLFGKKNGPVEIENPSLLQAMDAVAKNDNPESRSRLYQALLDCTLLVPVPEIPDGMSPGHHNVSAGVRIQLTTIPDSKGVRITPAFTDVAALKNFDSNTPYIGLKSIDLFRILAAVNEIQDILVNPFDPVRKMLRPGGRVTRREILQLANGAAPTNTGHQQFELKEQEKVMIGLPANPPSIAAQELLRSKGSEFSEVAVLYFFQMARAQRPSTTVIGIGLSSDASRRRKQEIANALGSSVQSELKGDQFLDFMFLEGPFGDNIRKIGGLIFRR